MISAFTRRVIGSGQIFTRPLLRTFSTAASGVTLSDEVEEKIDTRFTKVSNKFAYAINIAARGLRIRQQSVFTEGHPAYSGCDTHKS